MNFLKDASPISKEKMEVARQVFRSIGKRIFSEAYKVKFSNSAESALIAKEFDDHAQRFSEFRQI